jgi:hypothetical protein
MASTETYEMIRALPMKGTNWKALSSALVVHYLAVYAEAHDGAAPWAGNTTDAWAMARTPTQLRTVAMEAANFAVGVMAQRSSFIPPSPETLSWGGFLGGEVVVYKDRDAESEVIAEVTEIIRAHI